MSYVVDGLSAWSISSHIRIVLKGLAFGPRLFISFLSTKRVMTQKCFREMGNFRSMCRKTLIKVISGYHDLGILFCSLKRFGRFETVASLDAYQITKYQFISKTHHFFVAWFSKNSRKSFWIKNFRANCLSRRDQKVYSIFQNRAPWGTKVFYSNGSRWKWVFVRITNNDHQFFRRSYYQKLGDIFSYHFYVDFMIVTFIPFFRNVNKIHNDKRHSK